MTDNQTGNESKRAYPVDKFITPSRVREEFIGKVRDTHQLLRTRPGFMRDFELEKSAEQVHTISKADTST